MQTKRSVFKLCLEIGFIYILSYLLVAFVYPDLMWNQSIRFTSGHDIELPFQAAFIIARQFISGNLELWNFFDQNNHAYTHLGTGLYTIYAILEGLIFSLIFPYLSQPAIVFHKFHAVFYFGSILFIRTVGGYALARLFLPSLTLRIIACVLLNTVLASAGYSGLMVDQLYVLSLPIMYFLIRYHINRNRSNLIVAITWYILCVAMYPLMALGYFFVPFNLLIFSYLIITFIGDEKIKKLLLQFILYPIKKLSTLSLSNKGNYLEKGELLTNRILRSLSSNKILYQIRSPTLNTLIQLIREAWFTRVLGLSIVINVRLCHAVTVLTLLALLIIPVLTITYFVSLLMNTYYTHDSGLGDTTGRLNSIYSPLKYLSRYVSGTDPWDYLFSSVNYSSNQWSSDWSYSGGTVLFLVLLAVLFSRNKIKYTFFGTVLLIISTQFMVHPWSIWAPGHFITAFTNPFASLIRHTHMVALLVPYFLFPLVLLGLREITELPRSIKSFSRQRTRSAILLLVFLGVVTLIFLPTFAAFVHSLLKK